MGIGIIHRGLSLAVDLSSDRSEGQDAGQLEKCGYVRLVEEGDLSLGMDQPLKLEAVDERNRQRRLAGYLGVGQRADLSLLRWLMQVTKPVARGWHVRGTRLVVG